MCLALPNAYRIPCSRCETLRRIRIGLPTVTRMPIWLHHRYRIVLPIITSRGVKYTHDINCTVLHSNRGPPGLCGIPQASDPKKVVVTDPPTARHNVATPHAVATLIHGGCGPHDHVILGVRCIFSHRSKLFW